MRNCPDCSHDLIDVSFETQNAGKIHCLYCSNCGGAFFDHWDANLLSLDDIRRELSRLFKQNEEVIKIKENPVCPMDQNVMEVVQSAAIPQGVKIFACKVCHGNWFPKGELVKFKMQQQEKIMNFKKLNIPMSSVLAVFLPLLFFAVFTALTFYTKDKIISIPSFQFGARATIYQKMLQVKMIGKESVEISFFTDDPTKSVIYYQAQGMLLNKPENDFSRYHYARIDGLIDPTQYLFQISSTDANGKAYVTDWVRAK